MSEKFSSAVSVWAPMEGVWEIDPDSMTYTGAAKTAAPLTAGAVPYGIALSGVRFDSGKVRTTINLSPDAEAGRIMLGFSSVETNYVTAGLGSNREAYIIEEFDPEYGWRRLTGAGSMGNLAVNYAYPVEVGLEGQRISLKVDDIKVLEHILREPLGREQIGLFARGANPVTFGPVEISAQSLSAFVVMQFTPQFDALFEEVIRPVCAEMGIVAYRASDIYRPGVIIQDITQGLAASNVIISEVTPANPNVFYELGYAHALQKPAILLADRDTTLPFDISGHRVIFYDNTIGGKSALETGLRQHLTNILR